PLYFMSEDLRSSREKFERTAIHTFRKIRNVYDRNIFSRSIARRISRQYRNATSFLDIGSGNGYLGDALKWKVPHAQVALTDIENGSHSGESPFIRATATRLPFKA